MERETSDAQDALLSEDLATHHIVYHVQHASPTSVAEVQNYVESIRPDLRPLVDDVLQKMESAKIIKIDQGEITKTEGFLWMGSNADPTRLRRYLPDLLATTSNRVLINAEKGLVKTNKENLVYVWLPEIPEARDEIQKIIQEAKAKIVATSERYKDHKSQKTRLVALINGVLNLEDCK